MAGSSIELYLRVQNHRSSCPRKKTILIFSAAALLLAGCASTRPENQFELANRQQAATIQSLNKEIKRLNSELDELTASRKSLDQAKNNLEQQMKSELSGGDLSVSMEDKGLVVTVLERVLFDSGTAELKDSARETLGKVATFIMNQAPNNMIYIEGHTDNVPIRHSQWKSNWELSTARATEVVHFFVEQAGIHPTHVAATGYGEFQPVVSNDAPEDRAKNRRVEIVVSPKIIHDQNGQS